MAPNDMKYLCVSIHDVAPANWMECQRLLETVRAVADVPLTLLVIPQYHGRQGSPAGYERMLEKLLAEGHELALHGYTHQEPLPIRGNPYSYLLRTVYTQREGEFAALTAAEARHRIAMGLAWFRQRNWPVRGFVAPAWLMGPGCWSVLPEFPFEYTTTLGRFYFLSPGEFSAKRTGLFSPSLVYTARNAAGRLFSSQWISFLGQLRSHAPLMRLSLHPRDARYPTLLRHAAKVLEQLLQERRAVTKALFSQEWRTRRDIIEIPLDKSSPTSP